MAPTTHGMLWTFWAKRPVVALRMREQVSRSATNATTSSTPPAILVMSYTGSSDSVVILVVEDRATTFQNVVVRFLLFGRGNSERRGRDFVNFNLEGFLTIARKSGEQV
jgi:hypothetical protein